MDLSTTQSKSDRILESIKQSQRSKKIVDVEMELVKVVVFLSGGIRYCFYGSDIKEILPPMPVSWVPGLPGYLPGLINIRGDIESVIDLGAVLGNRTVDISKCMIAMLSRNFFRSGVLIDSIEDVIDIPVSSIKPPLTTLNGAARDLVSGEIEIDGNFLILLDADKLAAKVRL